MKIRAIQVGSRIYVGAERPSLLRLCFPGAEEQRGVLLLPDELPVRQTLDVLGVPVEESGAESSYAWPGATPMEHQVVTTDFMVRHQHCAILNEIGTGKTLCALWGFDRLRKAGLAKRMLVLCTKSTMHSAWGDEVFHRLSAVGVHARVLSGPGAKRVAMLRECTEQIVITNFDSFSRVAGLAEEAAGKFDIICVDEATAYKNARSERFKALYRWIVAHPTIRVWIMTGTPTPQTALDAWPLARLIHSPVAPPYYGRARDWLMRQVPNSERWVNRPEAAERVAKMLQPAVRFSREQCLDLPETTFETRDVELAPKQARLIKELEQHKVAELEEGGAVTAYNEGVATQRLLQVSAGSAYTDGEEGVVEVVAKPRIDEVISVIEQSSGKVLVFTPWRGVLANLERRLSAVTSVAAVHGGVSAADRRDIFKAFQEGSSPRVIVAVPTTMAHGLTLTAATTICWYSPPFSNEVYQQANGRIERMGKQRSLVVHIVATDLERRVFDRLRAKQRLQGVITGLIEEGTT